jgi:hypothetical protein
MNESLSISQPWVELSQQNDTLLLNLYRALGWWIFMSNVQWSKLQVPARAPRMNLFKELYYVTFDPT